MEFGNTGSMTKGIGVLSAPGYIALCDATSGPTKIHMERISESLDHPVDVIGVSALATTICFLSIVFLLGRLLRASAGHTCPVRLRPYLLDLVTSFQLLACSLENGHIRGYAGNVGFTIGLVCIPLFAGLTIAKGSSNPCNYVMSYMQGEMGIIEMSMRIGSQVIGGLLSYQYALLFWSLELSEGHTQRLEQTQCFSDLNVPLVAGFAVEFIGTIVSTMLATAPSTRRPPSVHLARCIADATLVLAGVELTGMYLNPINATNQTFGCHGTGKLEHLVVYWGAPFVATACACVMQRHLLDIWKTMAADADHSSRIECNDHQPGDSESILKSNASGNGIIRHRSNTEKHR